MRAGGEEMGRRGMWEKRKTPVKEAGWERERGGTRQQKLGNEAGRQQAKVAAGEAARPENGNKGEMEMGVGL